MANKKRNVDINADRFDELLAIAGYTYPRSDKELEQFEALYKEYDFELKDVRINPEEIINNTFRKRGKVINIQNEEAEQDISEIRLAARKGCEEIPQSILEKMKSKHSDGNKQS
jgi:F0F1-type ATP synthase membrane subunit b/b'